MLEKKYDCGTPYNAENSCEYVDTLVSIEKELLTYLSDGDCINDDYIQGIIGGVCIAIAAFGDVHGAIPYSEETDEPFIDFAIENCEETIGSLEDMHSCDDECGDECEGCGECGEELLGFTIDSEYFENPKDFERFKKILLAFADVK